MKTRRACWSLFVSAIFAVAVLGQQPKADLFTRLDANKDGKVTKEELPDGQKPNFAKIDTSSDGSISREELNAYTRAAETIKPTQADVAYGPHERNKIDLYLAESTKPTPLVLFIHGGGFRGGDKSTVNAGEIRAYQREGWSVAAINYRFTDVIPAPGQYLDCGRALQFLRHNAAKYNLDPKLVASTGGSAGAGTSLWLAFHDDLADPKSDDPVARESTRLVCTVVLNGQSSYDPRFAEKAGLPRPNFERHAFFEPFYDIKVADADTPEAYKRYDAAAPITFLTKDDPPTLMNYTYQNVEVTNQSNLGLVVHHPKLGIALKEQMDKLGIECIVQYRAAEGMKTERHGGGEPTNAVEFIRKHFAAAKK
jgi:acetyl esterase/lipase